MQISKVVELKELQQRVVKERERKQWRSAQLDDFQEIGVQLSMKEFYALHAAQAGKKEITKKLVEHHVTHDLTTSQEVTERIRWQVKEITQQYEYFKININEYTMSS